VWKKSIFFLNFAVNDPDRVEVVNYRDELLEDVF
jgi:hypothetical protein